MFNSNSNNSNVNESQSNVRNQFNAVSSSSNSVNSAAPKSSVSSNSVRANSVSNAPAKKSAEPKNDGIQTLADRTSISDIDTDHRNIEITTPKGQVIKAQLEAPSFKHAEQIDAARSKVTTDDNGRNAAIRFTPTDYQTKLFGMYKSMSIDNMPTHMSWKLLSNLDWQTNRWLLNQASSFLTDLENPDNER